MRKIPVILVLLCSLFLLLSSVPSFANDIDSLPQKIDSILKKYNTTTGPGCAVSIIKDGKVIFKKGYGIANLEYGIPITPSTVFNICSVSKQFTGFAISTLIQEGKISEDDDIRKYLPDVPQFDKPITIRHLLHHTSGLRDYIEGLAAGGWFYDEMCSFTDVMRMVKHQQDLNFEPGAEWLYCNTGYNLLAAIVEKVTGKSFVTWTDDNVFKPLGMHSSLVLDDYRRIIKDMAYSYFVSGPGSYMKNPSVLAAYGSGSIFSSAEDMTLWITHFEKEVAAKNPVYLRMLKKDVLNNGDTVRYGYGLSIEEYHGLKVIWHSGAWAGYRSKLLFYPEAGLSLVLLSNGDDNNLPYQKIADLFLKDKFKLSKDEQLGQQPTVTVDTSLLKKYTGIYEYASGTMTITSEDGQLNAQYSGESKYALAAKSDSTFWWPEANTSFTFIREGKGAVNQFKFRSVICKKVTLSPAPAASQLPAYTGTYYSEELGSEYMVDVVDGKLYIHHRRLGDFELTPHPFHKDAFKGYFGTFHFVKNNLQKVIGFKLSGNTVRNLRFNKITKSYQK